MSPTRSSSEYIRIDQLDFDSRNPRLAQYGTLPGAAQDEILQDLWTYMAVDEVAMSIAANGYWEYDPIVAVKDNSRFIVIEGNRRLAAVRLLLDQDLRQRLRATDLPPLAVNRAKEITARGLPVVVVPKREDAWVFLGFKHINGPSMWRSFPKAKYIAEIHNSKQISLADIALTIGDKHRTVQRLYRAYMVLDQAERSGIWKRENAYGRRLSFSHLMTGLDYDEFQQFLKISDVREESPNPVPKERLANLRDLCIWLWGEKEIQPKIKSQNPHLSYLRHIFGDKSQQGLRSLQRGDSIEIAFEISKGDDIVFGDALLDAKSALQKAQSRVTTGFRGQKHLLDRSEEVLNMASDLHNSMLQRLKKRSEGE